MILVELNLMFADILGCKSLSLAVEGGLTLEELSARLGLAYDDMGIMLINRQWAPLTGSMIQDGDSVQLYPFMEGG
ncbi:MAG: hypothetical protein FWF83_02190 [Clostridiales bacterium]|nr:hypothetical protein [Clostridiales bacterium]